MKKNKKILIIILIILGVILIVGGVYFFAFYKKNKHVVCQISGRNYIIEKKFETDYKNKAITYEDNKISDYSKDLDTFNEYCENATIIKGEPNPELEIGTYCDYDKKLHYEIIKFYYEKYSFSQDESDMHYNEYQYIDNDGTLKKKEFISDMEKRGYTCK